jgi:hypothetical protein
VTEEMTEVIEVVIENVVVEMLVVEIEEENSF